MDYRLLGATGLKVGAIGVGCMTFGWRADAAEVDRIVTGAAERGVNLFDTSGSYGRGASETLLGEAVHRHSLRDKILIATKVGMPSEYDAGINASGNSRHNVIRQCELSLKRLRVDHIDLLQVHRPDPRTPIDETLHGLDQLVRRGLVRYAGTSNFEAWQIVEALWCSATVPAASPVSEQCRLNILDRRNEVAVSSVAARFGVGLIAYSPLAEGLLTGKYRSASPLPPGSRFAVGDKGNRYDERLTPAVDHAIQRLASLAAAEEISLAGLSLRWVLSRPSVASALVGPSTWQQLEDLLTQTPATLTDAALQEVDMINAAGQTLLS